MLTNNYLVTFDEMVSMGIPRTPLSYSLGGNKIMVKQDLTDYFYVNTTLLASYSSNQGVKYQDIAAATPVSIDIYGKCATGRYVWYSINDSSMTSPVLLSTSTTATGTLVGSISIYSGSSVTFVVSDINGPNVTGYKPTAIAINTGYPTVGTSCTGFQTSVVSSGNTVYVSGNNVSTWC